MMSSVCLFASLNGTRRKFGGVEEEDLSFLVIHHHEYVRSSDKCSLLCPTLQSDMFDEMIMCVRGRYSLERTFVADHENPVFLYLVHLMQCPSLFQSSMI